MKKTRLFLTAVFFMRFSVPVKIFCGYCLLSTENFLMAEAPTSLVASPF